MKFLIIIPLAWLSLLLIPAFAAAQEIPPEIPESEEIVFTYDARGNRISRYTIVLKVETDETDSTDEDAGGDEMLTEEIADEMAENQEPSQIYAHTFNGGEVKIYPNPTKGLLKVEISNLEPDNQAELLVYNLQGANVLQLSSLQRSNTINLKAQPKGTYFLRLQLGEEQQVWKIIKE